MIFILIFNFLVLLSLLGYSFFFKKIINNSKAIVVNISDFFYGLFFILFLSLLINLFFPLKIFTLFIFIFGLLLFILAIKNKIYNINFSRIFILITLISFIVFYNGNNVDSPMYHLQIIKWLSENKINLGLINLEMRFGNNSSWHSILALMDVNLGKWSIKYYISSVFLAVIIAQSLENKLFNLSSLFLFLSVTYLLLFSYLHPFNNGIILNHLGNPETDIVAMLLFIFSFYLFLVLMDENFKNNELIDLFFIVSFLAITTKLSNITLAILIIFILVKNKKYKVFKLSNYIILFTGVLWTLRSFLLSGCLLFPVKITCLNTLWLKDPNKIEFFSNIIMGYARDTRLRDKYLNFEYIIKSNQWLGSWFQDYFLNTSLLKITSFIIILCLFAFLILLYFKRSLFKKNTFNQYFFLILIFFLITIYLWFKAPEIRFGWGWILALPSLSVSLLALNFKIKNYRNFYLIIYFLIILLSSKHFEKFVMKDLVTNKKIHNYDNIVKIGSFNGVDIYKSNNNQCFDFTEVCVNESKKNYDITSKFGYTIYLSEIF
jgi:hypothetical protein